MSATWCPDCGKSHEPNMRCEIVRIAVLESELAALKEREKLLMSDRRGLLGLVRAALSSGEGQHLLDLANSVMAELAALRRQNAELAAALVKLDQMLQLTSEINPNLRNLLRICADPSAILRAYLDERVKPLKDALEKIKRMIKNYGHTVPMLDRLIWVGDIASEAIAEFEKGGLG